MSKPFGNRLKLYIDGGSHDDRISLCLDGLPAGLPIDAEELYRFLLRRAPGQNAYSTARKESDKPIITSGITDGKTDGNTLLAVIRNENTRSQDYPPLFDTPRPSHADYPAVMKYGTDVDLRGGGHFSGRLTSLLCVAGGMAKQVLFRKGICVFAHIESVGDVFDTPFPLSDVGEKEYNCLQNTSFPVLSEECGDRMKALIEDCRRDGDSVGGSIECAVTGLPVGIGEHMFGSVEAAVTNAVFAVPAVKGIAFGSGFEGCRRRGSENNDPYRTDGKKIYIENNNAGGILGGMTSGAPLVFSVAVKPTPTIGKVQNTVSLSRMENTVLAVGGRHDPCIVPRAVPTIEAAASLALLDLCLGEGIDFQTI